MKNIFNTFCYILYLAVNITNAQSFEGIKTFGGIGSDYGKSITTDNIGNIYVTGTFEETVDFDPGVGVFNLTATGYYKNTFICKIDVNGNFVWAKQFEGNATPTTITLNSVGEIFIAGIFNGTVDFHTGSGVFNLTTNIGRTDIFITKLDTNGNFISTLMVGGNDNESLDGIAIDNLDNIYITGYFEGTVDFDPGPQTYNLTASNNQRDVYILKLDTSGDFIGAKKIGGISEDLAGVMKIDDSNNIYVLGTFSDTVDFDFESTVDLHHSNGGRDIFILKLSDLGDFIWAKSLGSTSDGEYIYDIDFDTQNNLYITGMFSNTVDFDPNSGVFNLTSEGWYDTFILKLDTMGDFLWAKRLGGISIDSSRALCIDSDDNLYLLGTFSESVIFNPNSGEIITSQGETDIHISKLDKRGRFIEMMTIGGINYDYADGLVLDNFGHINILGSFKETINFNPEGSAYRTSNGDFDFFILKLSNQVLNNQDNTFKQTLVNYPNPTNKNSTINLGKFYNAITLNIRNITGQLISTKNYKITDSINFSIDGNSGLYFAEILAGDKKATLKIVKQ